MSEELKECPSCQSPYGYETGEKEYTCPECSFVWILEEPVDFDHLVVLDVNGVALANGDSVVVIKDLPVKGAPKPVIKTGTKVKNIRLAFGDHNLDCKIDGFGSMALKSEFVKKSII